MSAASWHANGHFTTGQRTRQRSIQRTLYQRTCHDTHCPSLSNRSCAKLTAPSLGLPKKNDQLSAVRTSFIPATFSSLPDAGAVYSLLARCRRCLLPPRQGPWYALQHQGEPAWGCACSHALTGARKAGQGRINL
jgi:hypothetical protein